MIADNQYNWSMTWNGTDHTWTTGKDYDIEVGDVTVKLESDNGTQEVPIFICNRALFAEVFGIDLPEEISLSEEDAEYLAALFGEDDGATT